MAILLLPVLASAASAAAAPADIDPSLSPELRGRAIAEEMKRRDEGFGDTATELTMILTAADGRERIRRLSWQTLEVNAPNEGDKSLTLFHEPRDIEGTAFLSFTRVDRDDDQWLFLPALKRVKRITANNKSSAFVGSEFAYEDLLSAEVEKFTYRWLKDDACGDLRCYVIERRPGYENSGYSRQVVWIDQEEFRPMKIEYYDHKDKLKKTLSFEDYRRYLDRFWRAHRLRMDNRQTGKTTVLSFADFRFQSGLAAKDFDPSALRRQR